MAGVMAPPPTAEEGRRRRAGVQVLAAAVAIAAVVVGSAVVAGQDTGGGVPGPEPPTPTPTVRGDWLDAIPATFPLDRGLHSPTVARTRSVHDPHPTWVDKVGCRPVSSAERLDARLSWAAGGHRRRSQELALFPDDTSAAQQFAELQSGAIGCPERAFIASDEVLRYSFVPVDDDRSLLLGLMYVGHRRVPGRQAAVVAQVGNAVLVAALRDQSTAAAGAPDAALDGLLADAAALVEKMCVFAEHGCGDEGRRGRAGT